MSILNPIFCEESKVPRTSFNQKLHIKILQNLLNKKGVLYKNKNDYFDNWFMIGVVVGVVLAAVVFTLNTKDQKAVRQYQENKKKEEEKKQKAEKQQKEALDKIRNDPETKKRREENDKKMREKLFDGISQSDRKLLEEYLDSKKNTGKSQAEIVKDATGKAGIFVLLMLLVLVGSVFAIVFLIYEGDTSKITNGVHKLLTSVYPKFNSISPSSNNEL